MIDIDIAARVKRRSPQCKPKGRSRPEAPTDPEAALFTKAGPTYMAVTIIAGDITKLAEAFARWLH
jgi:hypothetical protein